MQKNNLTEKISALDDESFRTLIVTLAGAHGIQKEKIAALTTSIPRLKSAISSMSDDQLKSLLSSFGADAAATLDKFK